MNPRILWENLCAACAGRLGLFGRYTRPLTAPAAPIRSVLVLCQGNICRSPYAAARLSKVLKEREISGITVRSAGAATNNGKPAEDAAIETAMQRGVDLRQHAAAELSPELLKDADLILIMDVYQKAAVRLLLPEALKKTMYLGALLIADGHPLSIPDPFGHPLDVFGRCFSAIDRAVDNLAERLHARSSRR